MGLLLVHYSDINLQLPPTKVVKTTPGRRSCSGLGATNMTPQINLMTEYSKSEQHLNINGSANHYMSACSDPDSIKKNSDSFTSDSEYLSQLALSRSEDVLFSMSTSSSNRLPGVSSMTVRPQYGGSMIPESVLNKLKCYLCDGYLNASPVVVKDGHQICAKCFKILPQEEKVQCQKQVAFEAIGSCLTFPCRYHKMGCQYTSTFNEDNEHELECKKRYFTVPDVVAINRNVSKYESLSDASTSKASSDELVITQNCVNITLEESLQTLTESHPFPALNSLNNNNNSSLYENIYSTIGSRVGLHCLNCNGEVTTDSKNVCLFGHVTCVNCKSDMCVACVKNLDGHSRIACKNASKGCKEVLMQGDVGFHRDNCEFNEIHCPVDKCIKRFILTELVTHLKEEHCTKIFQSDEFTKNVGQKDQNIVLVCHNGIFKCLYFYYVNSAEIVVTYLGPCVKASEFYFEVTVAVHQKVIKKKLLCTNWNDYMLAKGVNLDREELKIKPNDALKFQLHLKIYHDVRGREAYTDTVK